MSVEFYPISGAILESNGAYIWSKGACEFGDSPATMVPYLVPHSIRLAPFTSCSTLLTDLSKPRQILRQQTKIALISLVSEAVPGIDILRSSRPTLAYVVGKDAGAQNDL